MKQFPLGLLAVVLTCGTLHAHFIWVIPAATGESAAVVYSDSPRTDGGEPMRITKNVTISLRGADRSVIEELKGTSTQDVYRVDCPGTGLRTLAVVRNVNPTNKPGRAVTYIGKALLPDPEKKSANSTRLPPWVELGLEIIPVPEKGADVFQVVYRCKPIEKAEVEVYKPGDSDTDKVPTFTSDKDGLIVLKGLKTGRYGLLVEQEFDEKGTINGQSFTRRSYTSSLVIERTAAPPK